MLKDLPCAIPGFAILLHKRYQMDTIFLGIKSRLK